ncbi:nucleotide exchange factor GrpE [Coriobacteriia bacterium Es71-Z0120]|uniref:nucleotide exchange factor GrpE n=1 Tax=Parvivirga hydrogeniphila TaxID=2939460 RepID=UPI002260DE87|nr:nucleotide exchange factor GrpE [Parvivirga hydrogeniphila]MCL4078375.1 nucleotide exchange factor GrpE [Parvivirga hydrogeniphila]
MAERKHTGSGGGPVSEHERRDDRAAEAVREDVSAASAPLDPELEADLGAELDLRGDQLQAELEAARQEAAEHLETAQRVRAEFENYRKRVARDQAEMAARAGERIIVELLPVLDNLERAIDHVTAGGDLKQLLQGVEMVHKQMLGVLAKEGVEAIDPFGQPFDPARHQAVGQREDASVPEGTVLEVYQKGYSLAGRIIRPAMVVVSVGGQAAKE